MTKKTLFILVFLVLFLTSGLMARSEEKPLILQEMTWTDVRDYLKTSDMIIIPIGSTEQHGPHLPLGTDYYEAVGISERISAKTGVVLAPVLFSGYSVYHSGFEGTLSLKPETMEQVLFETAEILIKYGFRRFMFYNYHGGNNIVQQKIIHRINHATEAVAVAIGVGSSIMPSGEAGLAQDDHAGVSETSMMLFLKPELVKLERAEKPEMSYSHEMEQLSKLAGEEAALGLVRSSLMAVPESTKKKGASHELSSNGIWSIHDPKEATRERGRGSVEKKVARAVKFIEAWKKVK